MRRLIRREPDPAAKPPVCLCAQAILLRGWSQELPPEPCLDDEHAEFFTLFDIDGFERLWRAHAPLLRETARRWGWHPQVEALGGRRLFCAEAAAEMAD